MSRDEEARVTAEAEEAKRRLRQGIDKSKALVARYRARLIMLGEAVRPPQGGRLAAAPPLPGEAR